MSTSARRNAPIKDNAVAIMATNGIRLRFKLQMYRRYALYSNMRLMRIHVLESYAQTKD